MCQSSARILAGFFWACSGGLRWRAFPPPGAFVRVLLHPLILTIKSVPVASFTVLALFWLSNAANLSMLISFLMVVPVVYANTLEALFERGRRFARRWRKVFRLGPWRTAR